MKISERKSAFTLIELLVVIAIIALLMSILMPALSRVRDQAKAVMCQSRLREWGLLFKFYTDDYNGSFNPGWDTNEETTLWMNALRPYYKDNWDMLLCPTATRLMLNSTDFGTFKAASRETDTPDGGEYNYIFSYGINSWTNNMKADRGARKVEWFWKNVNNIQGANNIPVFADSTWNDAWPRDTDFPSETMDAFGISDQGQEGEINHFCIDRHDGFINSLFMDWSARRVGLKELWTLKWHREFNTAGTWTKAGGAADEDWPAWLRRFPAY